MDCKNRNIEDRTNDMKSQYDLTISYSCGLYSTPFCMVIEAGVFKFEKYNDEVARLLLTEVFLNRQRWEWIK